MFVRYKRRRVPARTKAAWLQTANSCDEECVTGWRASVAATPRRRRCNPGKTEIRARDDRRPDTTTVHIDCTEPPRDSLHGSYSTSSLISLPALMPVRFRTSTPIGRVLVLIVALLLRRGCRRWRGLLQIHLLLQHLRLRSRSFGECESGVVNAADRSISRNGVGKNQHRDQNHRGEDRKSTRLNSSHGYISYAVFCLKKKK